MQVSHEYSGWYITSYISTHSFLKGFKSDAKNHPKCYRPRVVFSNAICNAIKVMTGYHFPNTCCALRLQNWPIFSPKLLRHLRVFTM